MSTAAPWLSRLVARCTAEAGFNRSPINVGSVVDKSAVVIMTRTWTGQRGNRSSIPGRSKIFYCFSKFPDRPQSQRLFLFTATGGIRSVSKVTFPRELVFTPYKVELRMNGNTDSAPSYSSVASTWTLCLYLYSFVPTNVRTVN